MSFLSLLQAVRPPDLQSLCQRVRASGLSLRQLGLRNEGRTQYQRLYASQQLQTLRRLRLRQYRASHFLDNLVESIDTEETVLICIDTETEQRYVLFQLSDTVIDLMRVEGVIGIVSAAREALRTRNAVIILPRILFYPSDGERAYVFLDYEVYVRLTPILTVLDLLRAAETPQYPHLVLGLLYEFLRLLTVLYGVGITLNGVFDHVCLDRFTGRVRFNACSHLADIPTSFTAGLQADMHSLLDLFEAYVVSATSLYQNREIYAELVGMSDCIRNSLEGNDDADTLYIPNLRDIPQCLTYHPVFFNNSHPRLLITTDVLLDIYQAAQARRAEESDKEDATMETGTDLNLSASRQRQSSHWAGSRIPTPLSTRQKTEVLSYSQTSLAATALLNSGVTQRQGQDVPITATEIPQTPEEGGQRARPATISTKYRWLMARTARLLSARTPATYSHARQLSRLRPMSAPLSPIEVESDRIRSPYRFSVRYPRVPNTAQRVKENTQTLLKQRLCCRPPPRFRITQHTHLERYPDLPLPQTAPTRQIYSSLSFVASEQALSEHHSGLRRPASICTADTSESNAGVIDLQFKPPIGMPPPPPGCVEPIAAFYTTSAVERATSEPITSSQDKEVNESEGGLLHLEAPKLTHRRWPHTWERIGDSKEPTTTAVEPLETIFSRVEIQPPQRAPVTPRVIIERTTNQPVAQSALEDEQNPLESLNQALAKFLHGK
ncbi:hypothetical protein GMRT_10797 [Giardia muris]|uniref:Uncharacterized protein n=1 Tax=Giardia muris TaxID=5742 RepID=A0A4Z1SNU7_GIAMU|nr:hypothetical protein GMRT_10797 [Giardia muris]|eukprot:TNJ27494.1 hypothetical protein GMRT_10797 [Giardia muris]